MGWYRSLGMVWQPWFLCYADKGRHRWMSARAMEQLKAAQEWQKSASCTQCELACHPWLLRFIQDIHKTNKRLTPDTVTGLRKLLLTAQSPHVLAGDTQPASQNGCEEELSRITGSIFCLSPNTEEVWLLHLLSYDERENGACPSFAKSCNELLQSCAMVQLWPQLPSGSWVGFQV